MKEDLVRKFVEKLDYSYNYKTVNERQEIINSLCEIAGIEQLSIPNALSQSKQLKCCDFSCNELVHKEGSVYCEFHAKL